MTEKHWRRILDNMGPLKDGCAPDRHFTVDIILHSFPFAT